MNQITRIRLFPLFFHNGCSQSSRFPTAGQGAQSSGNEIGQRPGYSAHRGAHALMGKTELTFPAFTRFVDLQFNSAFAVTYNSTRSDTRVKFDSGVIFLDQSQFLLSIATNETASFL